MLSTESFITMLRARKGKLPTNVICLESTDDPNETLKVFLSKTQNVYEELGLNVRTGACSVEPTKDAELIFVYGEADCPHFSVHVDLDTPFKQFIADLGLTGLTEDVLKALNCREVLINDYETAVIKTLEQHYSTSNDDQFRENDFDWFKQNNVLETDNVCEDDTKNEVRSAIRRSGLCSEDDTTSVTRNAIAGIFDNISNEEENLPDTLSESDIAENEELLRQVREAYNAATTVIKESCNALFNTIKQTINDSLENNKFQTQLCVMYLEISDDVSTPVYKKLYEADLMTEKFNNELHRQTLKMGCPNCNKEWIEDITLLDKGIHEIYCPQCGMSRLIEK